nr:MAG TPA: hypothetical protein [Caudoviricetes sp.]
MFFHRLLSSQELLRICLFSVGNWSATLGPDSHLSPPCRAKLRFWYGRTRINPYPPDGSFLEWVTAVIARSARQSVSGSEIQGRSDFCARFQAKSAALGQRFPFEHLYVGSSALN